MPYIPKSEGDKRFVAKHIIQKYKDDAGNGPEVYSASKVKTVKRKKTRQGYDKGDDEQVYEQQERKLKTLSQVLGEDLNEFDYETFELNEDRQEIYKRYCDQAIQHATQIINELKSHKKLAKGKKYYDTYMLKQLARTLEDQCDNLQDTNENECKAQLIAKIHEESGDQ